jgi:hypothetical protein
VPRCSGPNQWAFGRARRNTTNSFEPTGSPQDLVEFFDIPFDVDNVKIKTRTGEKDRTVNLGDPRSGLRADYDVTGDVELLGGHPTLESIHSIASTLIDEHRSALYGKA